MNARNPSLPSPAADAEAALWAARLEGGTLAAADRNALDAWLAAAPIHRALLSGYCQFSADLEVQLPALVAAGRVAMPAPTASRRLWSWPLLTASALGAAAAVAFTLWFASPSAAPFALATAAAQRQAFTLADGTRVELNARSSLQVAFTGSERRVRLAGGEACFTVSKDASRPFIVETPAGSVRVTGTVFNVLAESPAALDVTVVVGSVAVRPGAASGGDAAAPTALVAGDRLTARATTGVVVRRLSPAALAAVLAWREGRVVFEDVPLSEALARFAHYHGVGISASPAAAALRISSRFNLDDLDGFFATLAELQPAPVQTARDAAGVYRVALRSER